MINIKYSILFIIILAIMTYLLIDAIVMGDVFLITIVGVTLGIHISSIEECFADD